MSRRKADGWRNALAVAGALSLASGAVSLFFSLGRRPTGLAPTLAPRVDSDDFLNALAALSNAGIGRGGTARLLDNGVEIFPALLAAIRAARQTINFMVYIWEPGRVSDRVFEALIERAQAGVQVRLLLDGMGGARAPRDGLRALERAGGRVAWFRTLRPGKLLRFHRRNHRRSIVIDGRVAFTGGAAIGDKWLGDACDEEQWRDSLVELRGSAVSTVQAAFAQDWAAACGELLVGPAYYPPEVTDGEAGDVARHVGVVSAPAHESHPLRKFFWLTLHCARRRIYLSSPYFVPDASTRAAVAQRARSGVDVRLLLPNELTDAMPIRYASRSYYRELLEAGVRIYEYQRTMMHVKALVVDGRWSVVGSANMDIRSKELNHENVVGLLDPQFAAQLEASFLADLEQAHEITLDEWRRRPWRTRLAERMFVLFAEQY